jgi:hypothetical protein
MNKKDEKSEDTNPNQRTRKCYFLFFFFDLAGVSNSPILVLAGYEYKIIATLGPFSC